MKTYDATTVTKQDLEDLKDDLQQEAKTLRLLLYVAFAVNLAVAVTLVVATHL